MKIAILGAAGLRTPLIVRAILTRQDRLGIDELVLMDIDGDHLELIGALTSPLENSPKIKFHIHRTTDPVSALKGADFVITTFRVGGIKSRIIDERVPLSHKVLGQETTGAGGFAMGLRSIPVLLDYIKQMKELCPEAWLINFANPAGMLTEAIIRQAGWERVVGICDGPASMQRAIAYLLQAKPEDIYLDYFGLNHLGWIKRVLYQNQDHLPDMLELIKSYADVPGLPFDPELLTSLGMLPNEYLYYYYYFTQAVENILKSGISRGEQITKINLTLLADLKEKSIAGDFSAMQTAYQAYLKDRGSTYMSIETGKSLSFFEEIAGAGEFTDEGYAGVALNLIEALRGIKPTVQILNVPNRGAIVGMDDQDVVEIPTLVSNGQIQSLLVGEIPAHCLGLIKQVKYFEHLTIEAAVENSYKKALLALTTHPLVLDFTTARLILDEYITQHKGYFPILQ